MSEEDNVLFVRKEPNDSSDNEVIDIEKDNDIILQTYKEMTKVTHEDIAKKLAESTSGRTYTKSKPEEISEDAEEEDDVSHDFDLVDDVPVWEIGCDCRATYKEDKIDYEATILDIYHDYTCLIEFLGYGNQQVEKLDRLMPSWGLEEQKKQIKAAEIFYAELDESDSGDKRGKSNRKQFSTRQQAGGDSKLFGPGLLPPQPPLPPMLANGGPMDDPEQNDALSAMLMSWYMSGYYTGLYHGQLKGKRKC